MRLVSLGQRTLDERVFRIYDRGLGIRVEQVNDSLLFDDTRGNDFVPVRECVNDFFNVLVVFQVFDSQISGRILVSQGLVLLEQKLDSVNAFFQLGPVVDMDMSCEFRVALRINLYDSVEQLWNTCSVAAHCRADRHTEKITELFYIQLIALVLEFIVHVQRHNDPEVHVNDLGGQVQVSLNIGRVHDIDDNIRNIVNQVLADVQFLRAVSRKRVGPRQVHQHELVSLVFEAAFLGVHCHSAVVSDMLVRP